MDGDPVTKSAVKSIKRLSPSAVETIFRRFQSEREIPRGELVYGNHYTLLVAVVLSAQATDKGVNAATKGLFAVADTPEKMLRLGEDGLKRHIRTIGLFNSKARHIMALSRDLRDHHDGHVPDTREELEKLAGVGRKTANVVLNILFAQPVIAVDTHIFRVSNRTGLALGKTPRRVEDGLERVVPDWAKQYAHHWLILHGRYVCKAQKPLCSQCLIADLCAWPSKTVTSCAPIDSIRKDKSGHKPQGKSQGESQGKSGHKPR